MTTTAPSMNAGHTSPNAGSPATAADRGEDLVATRSQAGGQAPAHQPIRSSPLAGTQAAGLVRSISAISPATLRSEFDVKVPAREPMKIDAFRTHRDPNGARQRLRSGHHPEARACRRIQVNECAGRLSRYETSALSEGFFHALRSQST
jgi:hypothetical protein